MLELIVKKQVHHSYSENHLGKIILLEKQDNFIGFTGYVEHNVGRYENNNLNTALLKATNSRKIYDILKNEKYSGVDIFINEKERFQGYGYMLFEKVIHEAKKSNFDQLIIYEAIATAKEFYENSLNRLLKERKIYSFSDIQRWPNIYDILF